jgi:iron complex transport system substrate-binding protein
MMTITKLMKRKLKTFFVLMFFTGHTYGAIISMSPAITEMLYALKLNEEVVGVSSYCHYPEDVKTIPRVGTPFSPHYEKIISLKPTVILSQDVEDSKFSSMVKKLGLKLISYKLTTLKDIKDTIRMMAKDLRSKELASIEESFKVAEKALIDKKMKGTFYAVISIKGEIPKILGFSLASKNTFLSDIVALSGLTNAAPFKEGYKDISLETFLRHPADYLFVFTRDKGMKTPDLVRSFKKNFKMKNIPKILILNNDYALIPGPRTSQLMKEIADGL